MKHFFLLLTSFLITGLSTNTAAFGETTVETHYSFVSFPVGDEHVTAGKLTIPETDTTEVPAVLIVHGSGGVDSRGPLYAGKLNEFGIATLEIDMWSPRNMTGGLDRPTHVSETLPDANAAFRFLASQPEIDSGSIGIMGFSWGGVVGMLTATQDSPKFKSVAALYPVCWGYNRVPGYEFDKINVTELLIISGTADDYDNSDDCAELVDSLPEKDRVKVSEVALDGVTHAFDRLGPPEKFFDPYAFRGQGGDVRIEYDDDATNQSLNEIAEFFDRTLNQ